MSNGSDSQNQSDALYYGSHNARESPPSDSLDRMLDGLDEEEEREVESEYVTVEKVYRVYNYIPSSPPSSPREKQNNPELVVGEGSSSRPQPTRKDKGKGPVLIDSEEDEEEIVFVEKAPGDNIVYEWVNKDVRESEEPEEKETAPKPRRKKRRRAAASRKRNEDASGRKEDVIAYFFLWRWFAKPVSLQVIHPKDMLCFQIANLIQITKWIRLAKSLRSRRL